MSTYLELKNQAQQLLEQAEEVRKQEVAQVVAEIKGKMAQYDISAADLGFAVIDKKSGKSRKAPINPIRYRGPDGQEWTGLGRQPNWMKVAVENGRDKEEFAV